MNYIKDGKNRFTVVIDNEVMSFDPEHDSYEALRQAVIDGDSEAFLKFYRTGDLICEWSDGEFEANNGIVTYMGQELPNTIQERLIDMRKDGFDSQPLLSFIRKVFKSGSFNVVNNLYNFMEYKQMPLSPNGNIIAWKGVKVHRGETFIDQFGREVNDGDLVDVQTGSIRNNVGDENYMPRHTVVDDCNQPCGPGLHIGNLEYAKEWTTDGSVVMVEADPEDIVSVPRDHNFAKARTCRYKVIGLLKED